MRWFQGCALLGASVILTQGSFLYWSLILGLFSEVVVGFLLVFSYGWGDFGLYCLLSLPPFVWQPWRWLLTVLPLDRLLCPGQVSLQLPQRPQYLHFFLRGFFCLLRIWDWNNDWVIAQKLSLFFEFIAALICRLGSSSLSSSMV